MMLIFDTSVIIAIEKNDKSAIKKISELSKIYRGAPQITFITYYEFLLGIKNRSFKNRLRAMDFLNNFNCLSATKKTAEMLAQLKDKCEGKGVSISLADLIIASHVKESNATLLTKDKAFERIEEIDKIILD